MFFKNKFVKRSILSLSLISILSFTLMYFSIPSNISLTEGQDKKLFVGFTTNATVNDDSIEVLSLSSEKVSENIKSDIGTISINPKNVGTGKINVSLLGVIPIKSINVDVLPQTKLIPVGRAIGVSVDTNGILVLGTGYVNSENNEVLEPAKGILKAGDLITQVNDQKIAEKEELMSIIENSSTTLKLVIMRNGEEQTANITPIISAEDGKPKIGIWVRDCTQGIGTMTFYNPKTGGFGALGHGVYDIDTKTLLSIKNGKITEANISDIKKGEKGKPGELRGETFDDKQLGEIYENTECGLYDKLYEENSDILNSKAMPIQTKENIKEGKAYILCNISGNTVDKYEINIESVDKTSKNPSKGMVIRITDKDLLEKTGGIVQGMSGSPIIQDNHIIGAVTHVFVNDPTKGYGIFIENMM